ncbi:MAG: sensor histidine kinase [Actinomycetota bacterium]
MRSHSPARAAPIVAWTIFVLSLGVMGAMLAIREIDIPAAIAIAIWVAATALVGAIVASRRPRNACGWLLQGIALVIGLGIFAVDYAQRSVAEADRFPATEAVAWLAAWLTVPGFALFIFLLLLFPTGALPSPRWRPVARVAGVVVALTALSIALRPGPLEAVAQIRNPLGVSGAGSFLATTTSLSVAVLNLTGLLAVASLVLRYRRAATTEREQIKWVAYASGLLVATLFFAAVSPQATNEASFYLAMAGLVSIPAAVGIAILRHRLFDIDILINRTIVYLALTVAVVGIYAGAVVALSGVLRARVGLGTSLVATGVVAVLFHPIRSGLQGIVNRVMYGERDDPYVVLSRLARRVEDTVASEAVLPVIAETVAHSLRLPYAAIELEHGEGLETAAEWGEPRGELVRLPLTHHGEIVGRLAVSSRSAREELSSSDERLLSDLARQIGPAAHAVRLSRDLGRSHASQVTAREEERRRLRRDLHDGLGPELAGVTLGMGAVKNLLRNDPAEAERLLDTLRTRAQDIIESIRIVVRGLAPPEVDQLGLVAALRERASQLSLVDEAGGAAGMRIEVRAPEELPPLPAAVEVAAYRIAMEALANVVRHSGASSCRVHISNNEWLTIEVIDDGKGLPETYKAGVGLSSMRERAAEIGGSCLIERLDGGGTRVLARLPVSRQ